MDYVDSITNSIRNGANLLRKLFEQFHHDAGMDIHDPSSLNKTSSLRQVCHRIGRDIDSWPEEQLYSVTVSDDAARLLRPFFCYSRL